MPTCEKKQNGGAAFAWRKRLCSLHKDTSGATAVEFAIVAVPFFMFAFGIMGLGLHFFTSNALEHGVETVSRQIRTGQAQNGDMDLASFKDAVCDETAGYINCDDLNVHIQSGTTWSDITPTPCLSGGSLTASAGGGTDLVADYSGGSSQVVLITACYEWKLAQSLPYLMLGDLGNGSALIQAASTFRTEPFE